MNDSLLYFLDRSREFLDKKGIPSARLDAEVILADILGMERIKLYSNFDMPLSKKEQDLYRHKIVERSTSKPVAYITGKKYFYHDEFIVNESVLIPRPETEELVEWVINDNEETKKEILDLCTGSGCIGITLKKERPQWDITLSDISPEALQVAKKNVATLLPGENLEIIESNLFHSLADKKYDIIVSNPPYIPITEKNQLMKDVLFEPALALFVEDEKSFFSQLLQNVSQFLKTDGKFYMEMHQNAGKLLQELGEKENFVSIVKKDLSGKERMICFKKQTH